ncbi:MAG: helix-turn-helix transcriptional regulator [Bacteriovoracaceae bacterium]|nr:helix-turn-helix transcriptional regulator [Bacteriovoracaceae bacterium]
MKVNDFFSSFIKIHILHHCEIEQVYGAWMIKELEEHGYQISPGSLYPIFKSLEKNGLLKSEEVQEGKTRRRYYSITKQGSKELKEAKIKLKELIGEILE